jgi:glutaredoxin
MSVADRRRQIIVLLDTRDDGLPELTRRDHSASGFVHHTAAREACPDCLANDRAMFGCETCRGRGYIETPRHRDPYAVESVSPYGIDISRHERTHERDRQIDRLGEQIRSPYVSEADAIADANKHADGWELARREMNRRFDYAMLERALEQLRLRCPDESPRGDFGLAFIDGLMPDPIRSPREAKEVVSSLKLGPGAGTRLREERNRQIRQWAKDGRPYQWIAAEVGLGDRQLREIINARRV